MNFTAQIHNPHRVETKLMDPPVMAEVSSTKEHVDLERNSKDLTMAAGDVQGNPTIFELEMIEAQEEDAAAAAYDEIVARYRRKRADRKARIVKELGEEAYLELEGGDDCLANDPDYVDEINQWIRIQDERHKANLRRGILPGYKKLSDSDLYLEIYSCLHLDSESDSNSDSEDNDDDGGHEDEEAEENSDSKEEEEGEEEEGELEAEKFISLAERRAAAAEAALGGFEWRTGPLILSWPSKGKSCPAFRTWTT